MPPKSEAAVAPEIQHALSDEQKAILTQAQDPSLSNEEKLVLLKSAKLSKQQKMLMIQSQTANLTKEQKAVLLRKQMNATKKNETKEEKESREDAQDMIRDLGLKQSLVIAFVTLFHKAVKDKKTQTAEQIASGMVHEKCARNVLSLFLPCEDDHDKILNLVDNLKQKALAQASFIAMMTLIARKQQGHPMILRKTKGLQPPVPSIAANAGSYAASVAVDASKAGDATGAAEDEDEDDDEMPSLV